ncbi:hypothetical protein AA12717_1849 [Gluconacetobacter sacchari DSM 12717]|uniref:Uncharacterized protein n=1 Tax=Gluconacetobacter sacchari DSM 12717 TaxID=1307940 RepID=A0ABQ0P754_9PROT|nr:hypothetical protein AA12717_1849 [Gluconacetobacter sacchari DSM 12717]
MRLGQVVDHAGGFIEVDTAIEKGHWLAAAPKGEEADRREEDRRRGPHHHQSRAPEPLKASQEILHKETVTLIQRWSGNPDNPQGV